MVGREGMASNSDIDGTRQRSKKRDLVRPTVLISQWLHKRRQKSYQNRDSSTRGSRQIERHRHSDGHSSTGGSIRQNASEDQWNSYFLDVYTQHKAKTTQRKQRGRSPVKPQKGSNFIKGLYTVRGLVLLLLYLTIFLACLVVLETIALSITAVVILLRAPTNVRRIALITIENTILKPGQKAAALIIFPLLHIFYLVALTTAGGPVIVFCYGFYDMIQGRDNFPKAYEFVTQFPKWVWQLCNISQSEWRQIVDGLVTQPTNE